MYIGVQLMEHGGEENVCWVQHPHTDQHEKQSKIGFMSCHDLIYLLFLT